MELKEHRKTMARRALQPYTPNAPGDDLHTQEAITDMLADLMHICGESCVEAAVDSARQHYAAECREAV